MVLIIEDDDISIKIYKLYLDKISNIKPQDILFTNNGISAIEIFNQYKNDISFIIMDFKLPLMDGLTASKEILKIKYVPIIMITASCFDNIKKQIIESGYIKYFLCKPLTLDTFEKTLLELNLI